MAKAIMSLGLGVWGVYRVKKNKETIEKKGQ